MPTSVRICRGCDEEFVSDAEWDASEYAEWCADCAWSVKTNPVGPVADIRLNHAPEDTPNGA